MLGGVLHPPGYWLGAVTQVGKVPYPHGMTPCHTWSPEDKVMYSTQVAAVGKNLRFLSMLVDRVPRVAWPSPRRAPPRCYAVSTYVTCLQASFCPKDCDLLVRWLRERTYM